MAMWRCSLAAFLEKGLCMDISQAARALAALSAFRLLVQAGPEGLAASKISDALDLNPSSLSFHLKELAHAGLVTSRHEGRFVIYAARYDSMVSLMAFLTENCCGGVPCMPAQQAGCKSS